ncbi:MAG TPA: ATP-binding protein [Bryobacteraceae bacterium]
MKRKALLAWSSGKDSAWTLHLLRQSRDYEVVALLTTVNTASGGAAMHETSRELLAAQAGETGLPLWEALIPWPCSNECYDAVMRGICERARSEGIEAIAFGDLFLEDIRRYREERLAGTGLTPIFPVWGLDTRRLAEEMIAAGVKARIVAVDLTKLPASCAGRDLDPEFLKQLPGDADPCGENGEFHTFVYDGPMFRNAVPVGSGATIERDGFARTELHLREPSPCRTTVTS